MFWGPQTGSKDWTPTWLQGLWPPNSLQEAEWKFQFSHLWSHLSLGLPWKATKNHWRSPSNALLLHPLNQHAPESREIASSELVHKLSRWETGTKCKKPPGKIDQLLVHYFGRVLVLFVCSYLQTMIHSFDQIHEQPPRTWYRKPSLPEIPSLRIFSLHLSQWLLWDVL